MAAALWALLAVVAVPLSAPDAPTPVLAAAKGRHHPRPSPTPVPTPPPAPGEPSGPPHPARILPPDPCAPFRRAGVSLAVRAAHSGPAVLRWRRLPPPLVDPRRRYLLDLRIGTPDHPGTPAASRGTVTIQLDPLHNPRTVNAFLFLVCNGYYRDTAIDRLIAGSLVEGASPGGIARGGPGFPLPSDPVHAAYRRSTVALVNSGPDAGTGRFLILLDTLSLPPRYTIFARVLSGMDLLDSLSRLPTVNQPDAQERSLPLRPPRISAMTIRMGAQH